MASLLRLLLAASLVLAAALPSARAGGQHQLGLAGWMLIPGSTPPDLAGGDDEEFALDSEGSSRRVLAGTGSYISYAALLPGNIPCSIPGNSYYTNCRAGRAVNAYTRSCSTINRCRS